MAASSRHLAVGVVIVAAGASRRMQGIDKTWAEVYGLPVIAHTVQVFIHSPLIDHIVLVVAAERVEAAETLASHLQWEKLIAIIPGGVRRRDSVAAGLHALPSDTEIVLIHDGARPLITHALIAAALEAVQITGAATAGVAVKDTITRVDAAEQVIETPARANLRAVQTPQAFQHDLILRAHHALDSTLDVTDDASMIEMQGGRVVVFPGAYSNLKITTPEDLLIVQALWSQF